MYSDLNRQIFECYINKGEDIPLDYQYSLTNVRHSTAVKHMHETPLEKTAFLLSTMTTFSFFLFFKILSLKLLLVFPASP